MYKQAYVKFFIQKMGTKNELNRPYFEKYESLGAETLGNQNGILVNILRKFQKKKILHPEIYISIHIFWKCGGDRRTDGQAECELFLLIRSKILGLIQCAPSQTPK